MQRTANAARTAPGLDHVNRLRFPDFQIPAVYFELGGSRGKTHHPAGVVVSDADTAGDDKFNFLPEKESIELCYEIRDPLAAASGGKIGLYTEFDKDPLWELDLAALGPDWYSHGKHRVKWDGRLFKVSDKIAGTVEAHVMKHDLTAAAVAPDKTVHADFPDGYVTIEHAPYKLRLSLTNTTAPELQDRPAWAWTHVHILLHSIELELGEADMIPAAAVGDDKHVLDKALLGTLTLPAEGVTEKVKLKTNIFPIALGEFGGENMHNQLEAVWGDGANIPIVAKIRMADSTGAEVKLELSDKGAVALGKAKFLWDWESSDDTTTTPFVVDARNFNLDSQTSSIGADKAHYPKSDNCHAARGGKRGEAGSPVFPSLAGYDPKALPLTPGSFPFKVEAWKPDNKKKRRWAAASQAWTREALKGRTGVVFQPSRMAGDNYTLSVYLSYAKRKGASAGAIESVLDVTDEPLVAPDHVKKKTGKFVVWHVIDLVRLVHKDGLAAPMLPGIAGGVNGLLTDLYCEMAGAPASYPVSAHRTGIGAPVDYDAECKRLLAASGYHFMTDKLAIDDSFDHAGVASGIQSHTYDEFVKKAYVKHGGGAAIDLAKLTEDELYDLGKEDLSSAGWDIDIDVRLTPTICTQLRTIQTWLQSEGLDTYEKYRSQVADPAFDAVNDLCSIYELIKGGNAGAAAQSGLVVLEVDFLHTFDKICWNKNWSTGMVWYGQGEFTGDTGRHNALIMMCSQQGSDADNFTHELGHMMFLPHAPNAAGAGPDGFDETVHDKSNYACLMTYEHPRPGFCGYCQLKVRGWLGSAMTNDPAANHKP